MSNGIEPCAHNTSTSYSVRVDLDRINSELEATSYSLASNGFVVSARAAAGRLTLDKPFHADLDLASLAATRYPGP
jgi:hypothetical protein